jgi:hypothetical protein
VEIAARRRQWPGAEAVSHPVTSTQGDRVLFRVVVNVRPTSVREPTKAYILCGVTEPTTQNNRAPRSRRDEIRLGPLDQVLEINSNMLA